MCLQKLIWILQTKLILPSRVFVLNFIFYILTKRKLCVEILYISIFLWKKEVKIFSSSLLIFLFNFAISECHWILTDGTKGRFLEHRKATIVDGEVAYIEPEEHVSLQLGQGVMPEPKIEYHEIRSSL